MTDIYTDTLTFDLDAQPGELFTQERFTALLGHELFIQNGLDQMTTVRLLTAEVNPSGSSVELCVEHKFAECLFTDTIQIPVLVA